VQLYTIKRAAVYNKIAAVYNKIEAVYNKIAAVHNTKYCSEVATTNT